MRLFFGPTVTTKLIDAQYEFKDELRATEKKLDKQGLKYVPLDGIACSIQF